MNKKKKRKKKKNNMFVGFVLYVCLTLSYKKQSDMNKNKKQRVLFVMMQ